ncbi:MAG TPA: MarR family transcriptional regulator [archaeon]|nr:MarR family transcriptional regulator [archaeon]
MDTLRKIGILMIVVAVVVAVFGVWLKVYNDKLAQNQVNETGSCYLSDGTCLHATSDSIMYVSVAIAAFLVGLGMYLMFRKEAKKTVIKKVAEKTANDEKKDFTSEAPKTLGPESKQIFDIVAQSNGAILQGELVMKSGMDKVKVSRVLDKLEMHGLIERRRHGMSNMVVLKK